jgi:TP901 family phage tail tape measure protein
VASRKEYEMLFQLNAKQGTNFSSTFKSAQSALTSMQGEIQTLSRLQSDVSAYQKQQAAVESTKSKLQYLQQQYQLLEKEMEEAGGASTKLEEKMLTKQHQIDQTNVSLVQQTAKLDQMGEALTEAGVDTDHLTEETKRLAEQEEEIKKAQEEVAESAEEMGDSGAKAMEAISSAIAAAGIATALREIYDAYMECVNAAGDFEASMSNVQALSGATDSELEQLSETAKEMGATTSFTATQSADAFSYMALAGWDVESMLSGIEPILNLAAAANMDLAEASDIVTDYLTAFGLTAEDTADFVDMMAYAMSNSNTNVSQLGEAYKSCAATANSMGYSVEETTAVLMTMANAGVKGSEAGTALSAIMTRLATDTKGCASALKEYGVYVYDEATGNMNSLSSILTGMSEVWATLTDEEQANLAKAIAGTSQYSKLQTIMAGCSETAAEGGQSFSDYAAALEDCSGSAGSMAATMLDNMNGQLTLMQSAFDGLKIAVGEEFTPVMSDLYGVGADVFSVMTDIVKENPELVKAIAAGTAVLAVTVGGITAYTAATKLATIATELFTSAIPGVGTIMSVSAAVAAITAGVVFLASANDDAAVSVKELTTEARELEDAVSTANTTYSSTVEETEATVAVADKYISKLEELEAAGLSTDEAQQQYHATLYTLCQLVPDLADYIDLETDTINGGTEALRSNTEAWKENALAQAMQDQLEAIYAEYADVLVEAEENSIGLTNAQMKLSEAEQKQTDTIDRMNEIIRDNTDATNAYNQANGTAYSVTEYLAIANSELSQEYWALNDSVESNAEEINAAQDEVEAYTKAIAEDQEAVGEAEDAIALAEEAVSNLTDAQESGSDASSDYSSELASISSVASDVTTKVQELVDAYDTAYESAYKSISGQYDLWDEVDKVVATSASTINENLKNQTTYWSNYNDNLAALSDRTDDIAGLDEMIASFADGSTDSVNAIAGMAAASDTELQEMVANWQALQDVQQSTSDSLADVSTNFSSTMETLTQEMTDSIQELDLSEEAAASAQATIDGYISTLESSTEAGAAAFASLSEACTAALDVSAESGETGTLVVNSYSDAVALGYIKVSQVATDIANSLLEKVDVEDLMESEGSENVNGYILGISSLLGSVETSGSDIGDALSSNAEAYSSMYSSGSYSVQGFINGVNGMIPSADAVAVKLATSFISSFKAAAGEGSPWKSTFQSGLFADEGLINGVDAGLDDVLDEAELMADAVTDAVPEVDLVLTATSDTSALDNLTATAMVQADTSELSDLDDMQIVTLVPQLVEALNGVVSAKTAEAIGGNNSGITVQLNLSPVYNVSGSANATQVRTALQDSNDELRDFILEVIEDDLTDTLRRSYR